MKTRIAVLAVAVLLAGSAAGGNGQRRQNEDDNRDRSETRLPNGKRQADEIVRDEYRRNLADSAELLKLSEDLKAELEKNDAFVLSLGAIKKTEEIEKLAKRIRGRLKRF